ncbi:hypothetical protein Taro_006472, partial [Colocasia esculenta]|nr:hypothetical protein [Colocasia esculenta]
ATAPTLLPPYTPPHPPASSSPPPATFQYSSHLPRLLASWVPPISPAAMEAKVLRASPCIPAPRLFRVSRPAAFLSVRDGQRLRRTLVVSAATDGKLQSVQRPGNSPVGVAVKLDLKQAFASECNSWLTISRFIHCLNLDKRFVDVLLGFIEGTDGGPEFCWLIAVILAVCMTPSEKRRVDKSDSLTLDSIRHSLIRQEDSIIFSLLERAQYCYNPDTYDQNMLFMEGFHGSLVEFMVRETERLHAQVGRYKSPDEHPFFMEDLPEPMLPPMQYPKACHWVSRDAILIDTLVGTSEPGTGPEGASLSKTETMCSNDSIHLAWRCAFRSLASAIVVFFQRGGFPRGGIPNPVPPLSTALPLSPSVRWPPFSPPLCRITLAIITSKFQSSNQSRGYCLSSTPKVHKVLHPIADSININKKIWEMYFSDLLPRLVKAGSDGNCGSTAVCDTICLQALSKRIHYGKFVAEAKFQASTDVYETPIKSQDKDLLMHLLTYETVETAIKERVEMKAKMYGQEIDGKNDEKPPVYKIAPSLVADLYGEWIMPLTKEVQVAYLLRRLD